MTGAQGDNNNVNLLEQIVRKMGKSWIGYSDIYARKVLAHWLAFPYNDLLGLWGYTTNKLADILFGGKGFKIKITKGMMNQGGVQEQVVVAPGQPAQMVGGTDILQNLIDDELFGKMAFKENIRRAFIKFLTYGTMVTNVGLGIDGQPEIRYVDGISAIDLDYDSNQVTRIASVNIKTFDQNEQYAIVCIDSHMMRECQVFGVSNGLVQSEVSWGTPNWYKVMGSTPQMEPVVEAGHMKSQWWRLPTEDVMHSDTPHTLGIISNLASYRECLKVYLQYKKEIGWKLPILFYNKAFDAPDFSRISVMKSFNELDSLKTNPVVWANPDSTQNSFDPMNGSFGKGVYPNNTFNFMDFSGFFRGINSDYSPTSGIKSKEQDCWFKTTMAKDQLLEIYDPPIRTSDFQSALSFELSKLGRVHRLGGKFFQLGLEGEVVNTAAQTLMADQDLLNFVTQLENYMERPMKQLVLALCDYWVNQGKLNILDVPTRMSEIEIIWDNSFVMDDNVIKQRMLAANGILSRHYILRHVFNMSNDEILQNDTELMSDPMLALQQMQSDYTGDHLKAANFGVLGQSQPPEVGLDGKGGGAKSANNGKNTAKGKTQGNSGEK